MEDLEKTKNLTIEGLIAKNQALEIDIIRLKAQLDLLKELFDEYHR